MIIYQRIKFVFIVLLSSVLIANCTVDYKKRGDELIDRLNLQVKAAEFDQLYEELSGEAKRSTPKDEFIRNMDEVVSRMKEVDESLTWKKGNLLLSNEYADLYFVHREMEGNGQKLNIEITFTYTLGLLDYYDICVMPTEASTGAVCATNALRKI